MGRAVSLSTWQCFPAEAAFYVAGICIAFLYNLLAAYGDEDEIVSLLKSVAKQNNFTGLGALVCSPPLERK